MDAPLVQNPIAPTVGVLASWGLGTMTLPFASPVESIYLISNAVQWLYLSRSFSR